MSAPTRSAAASGRLVDRGLAPSITLPYGSEEARARSSAPANMECA